MAAEINARHGDKRAVAITANISSKEQLKALVDQTVSTFGRLDTLVCNAASNPYYGPMDGISDEQFRKILDNNILSNHWLITFARPEIVRQGKGAIIIVSSTGALRGSPTLGAYCISKAADIQLARNLAVELGPKNVRVNCIVPGLVKTDFARALCGRTRASLNEYLKVDAPEAHRRARRYRPGGRLPRRRRRQVHDRRDHRHRRRLDDPRVTSTSFCKSLRQNIKVGRQIRTMRMIGAPGNSSSESQEPRPMKFQLAINMERIAPDIDMPAVAKHTLEMVQMADQGGFHIAWAAEHHALEMTIAPDPFQICAWWAAHTNRIRIGVAVAVAPYWHPIKLAGAAALFDLYSNGRSEFGIGSGAYQREFDRMYPGLKQTEGWRYMQEALPVIKALWAGDVEHKGEFWQFPLSTSVPKPLQDPHPPIWIAARAPITYDFAVAARLQHSLLAADAADVGGRALQEPARRCDEEASGCQAADLRHDAAHLRL